jgi:hypothetical protein
MTGAYIFVPKDYNTLTNERIIQLSGNDKSVEFCKNEIRYIVERVAPLLEINIDEFKRNKRNVKSNFEKLIEDKKTPETLVKTEVEDADKLPRLLESA